MYHVLTERPAYRPLHRKHSWPSMFWLLKTRAIAGLGYIPQHVITYAILGFTVSNHNTARLELLFLAVQDKYPKTKTQLFNLPHDSSM